MAIFNPNPDPDYPVLNGPGFIQHTYNQPLAQQQQFYYNGQAVVPTMVPAQPAMPMMGNMNPMDQSRRYDAQPTPMMVPAQQPQQTFGFNQLAEQSRRNMTTIPNPTPQPAQTPAVVASPWSVQTQPAQVPAMTPQFAPQQAQPASMYDPRYSAIYNCHPSIDRKSGVWGVQEVYTPCMAPSVNWNAMQTTAPAQYPQMTYPAVYQYPQQVQQPMQTNWEQIAKQTWGNQ